MTGEQEERHRALAERVCALSRDVDRFRAELEKVSDRAEQADRRLADEMADALIKVHEKLDYTMAMQTSRHADQAAQIHRIQASIDGLSFDLKEPMEVWRTTKYGAKAISLLMLFVRWIVPIGAAALIGYNAWQAKILTEIRAEIPQSSVSTAKPVEK
jgi:hypothetical protein